MLVTMAFRVAQSRVSAISRQRVHEACVAVKAAAATHEQTHGETHAPKRGPDDRAEEAGLPDPSEVHQDATYRPAFEAALATYAHRLQAQWTHH
jgi:hypothetical protein